MLSGTNRWSIIASHLPNTTNNEIKNYWNTNIKKRLMRKGIHSITHEQKATTFNLKTSQRMLSI
ncbi:hypothetical protein AAZX31_12G202400 [Glycine max]